MWKLICYLFLSEIQAEIFLLLFIVLLYNYIVKVLGCGFTLSVISTYIVMLQLAVCAIQYIHYPKQFLCYNVIWSSKLQCETHWL